MKVLFPVLAAFLVCSSCAPTPQKQRQSHEPADSAVGLPAGRKRLLMHYMPWYVTPDVRGKWGNHWSGHSRQHDPEQIREDGRRDIWSHYYPLIGTYDSTDRDVLECQLLQMKLAGVDGVIADWYGISDTYNYPEIHEATQVLFEVSAQTGMTFSLCFEDRTLQSMVKLGTLAESDLSSHLSETFQWLSDNWFAAEHYERAEGRPLLLNFGPIFVRDPAVWTEALSRLEPRPLFFALHHLWRYAGADGGFTWVHHDAFEKETGEEVLRHFQGFFEYLSRDGNPIMVSAVPGFHDVYDTPMRRLEHREGKTLELSLRAAMESPWNLVQLVTWNDYGEGTMIEPTREFGYRFLEIIQESRRQELGEAFPFTAEDLRLPARLLQARREARVPPESLEMIAQLLRQGLTHRARELFQQLAQ